MSSFRRSLAMVLLPLGLLAACGGGSGSGSSPVASPTPAPTETPTPGTADFSAFEREIQAFVDEREDVEGAGAIVVDRARGVVYRHAFGTFSEDRVYLLASSSKMITAGVLMRLADQGLLDVDAPVADAVAWGAGNPSITPAQLLSNSSGLVGLRPNPGYRPYFCQYLWTGTIQDCAAAIFTGDGDDADVIPPDTTFRYGGAQWQVAGGLAEAVTGRSWADLVRETYVEPCGLRTLAYNNHFAQFVTGVTGYPAGFDADPANLRATDNPNMEGGAYSDLDDYAKLLLMHLRGGTCDGGRVLSEEAVRRMRVDRLAAWGGSTGAGFEGYGFGWWIDRENPALAIDPGAYGAVPWIDEERGYAAFLALEATDSVGLQLFGRVLPLANAAIDASR